MDFQQFLTFHIVLDISPIPLHIAIFSFLFYNLQRWLGGAIVLGKLLGPGHHIIWITVRQGPTALAVGAGGGCLDIFYSHLSFLSFFSLSLEEGPT